MTNERIAFVDYIRVVACLLVMVVHACEQFYNMGPISQVATEDNRLWVSVYDGFFGRISVPLFMIVSAFLLFTCIQKAPRWINSLAKLTFGMYLMHIFFLVFIAEWIIGGDVARPLLPVWLAIPAIGLLTFVCCAVTTKLISLIPGSKYVIG